MMKPIFVERQHRRLYYKEKLYPIESGKFVVKDVLCDVNGVKYFSPGWYNIEGKNDADAWRKWTMDGDLWRDGSQDVVIGKKGMWRYAEKIK